MDLNSYYMFLVAGILIAATPGPSTLFALSQGLKFGFKESIPSVLGLMSGNGIYGILSLLGIGTILILFPFCLIIFKLLSIVYLSYLIYEQFSQKSIAELPTQSSKKVYLSGFTIGICNPAFMIFYLVFIPQFINKQYSLTNQMAIYSFTQFIIDSLVVLFYAGAANTMRVLFDKPNSVKWINRAVGIILIIALMYILKSFFDSQVSSKI
jgi:homoserine/homoserine lactone efflux protein